MESFANASIVLFTDADANANDTQQMMTSPVEQQGSYDFMTMSTLLIQPPIIVVGLLGNALCLCVFVGTNLRHQSISIYLAYLSLVDSIFLLTLLAMLLPWVGVGLVNRDGWCQLSIFLSYLCSFLSSWTVACFTAERFLVVYYPLQKKDWCTRRKAAALLAACTVVGVGTYGFTLRGSGVIVYAGDYYCAPLEAYEWEWFVMASIDTAVTFILPFSIIGVLNSCTATKLWLIAFKARRHEGFMGRADNNDPSDEDDSKNSIHNRSLPRDCKCKHGQLRLTPLRRLCNVNDEERLKGTPAGGGEALLVGGESCTNFGGVAVDKDANCGVCNRDGVVGGKPQSLRLSLTKSSSSSQRQRLSQRLSLYEMLSRNRRSIHMRATRTLLLISTGTGALMLHEVLRNYIIMV